VEEAGKHDEHAQEPCKFGSNEPDTTRHAAISCEW
jgi:hypothetical protein